MTSVLYRALNSARAFVSEIHPESAASALAGSITLGRGTGTSDLDIVVYYEDRPASFAETLRYDGWLVESFVYGPQGIDEWFALEAKERRPVALDMWSAGIPLVDNVATVQLQGRAQAMIAAGPEAISATQHADLRYGLTAAIDDLEGLPEPGEELRSSRTCISAPGNCCSWTTAAGLEAASGWFDASRIFRILRPRALSSGRNQLHDHPKSLAASPKRYSKASAGRYVKGIPGAPTRSGGGSANGHSTPVLASLLLVLPSWGGARTGPLTLMPPAHS